MKTMRAFRDKDSKNIRILNGGRPKQYSKSKTPILYEFDEDDTISFAEGTHGVLVLGGVGRGKTASFMLPMAESLIAAGLPGLIIDIKNNFTDQVRRLAATAGRENDIVEIGTHPTATPINLLAGLSPDETHLLIESLLLSGQEHSKNIEWLHSGVRLLGDIAILLRFVSQVDLRFAPSFVLLDRCINDYDFARTLFQMYLERTYDADDYTQQSFVKRVRTSAFHILSDTRHRSSQKYEEQLAFQLYGPRTVLGAITADESLCVNLSGLDCSLTLDYKELLKANKIVMLRFKHTQGHAAKLLAKYIKEKFYADVYRTLDDDYERPKQCFFMADEFQDVINVAPDNAFDDFSWFSKAREFGCINVVASQSLSSLYTNSLYRDQVNALVANCSTKIVLQNDDPAADSYFRHFCGLNKTLAQLGASEALVSRYDLKKREQVVKTLHHCREYERTRIHLNASHTVKSTSNSNSTTTDLLRQIDKTLLVYKLPQTIRARPDYVELVTKFDNLFDDLAKVEIGYSPERHEEVMTAFQELQKNYQGKATVAGVAEIAHGSIFLDIEADADIQDEVDDFVRNLMREGHAESEIQ